MKALLQENSVASSTSQCSGEAFNQLREYIEDLYKRKKPIGSMDTFEGEVKQLVSQVEREVIAEGLSQFDVRAKVVELNPSLTFPPAIRAKIAPIPA